VGSSNGTMKEREAVGRPERPGTMLAREVVEVEVVIRVLGPELEQVIILLGSTSQCFTKFI
jgi:hypothetical protein